MAKNMTQEQAEQVTADIRKAGKALATARTRFASAVKRAKEGNAHVALGYKSWTDYVATVFADMPGLGKADKEYLTAFMAGEGMSVRAVARVLGVSTATAGRMVKAAEERGDIDADRKVTGTDGKAQRKGTGKGTGKGKGKGESEGKREGVRLDSLKSDEVGKVALDAVAILNKRWRDGDVDAEAAIVDLLAMLDSHKITA